MIGGFAGGVLATTNWLLWWNGGAAAVEVVPDVAGIEFALSANRLHWRVENS